MNKIALVILGGVLFWVIIALLFYHLSGTDRIDRAFRDARDHVEEGVGLIPTNPNSDDFSPNRRADRNAVNRDSTNIPVDAIVPDRPMLPAPYEELWKKAEQAAISHYPAVGSSADQKAPAQGLTMPAPGGIFSSRAEMGRPRVSASFAIPLPVREISPEPGGIFSSGTGPEIKRALSVFPTADIKSPPEPGGRFSSRTEGVAVPEDRHKSTGVPSSAGAAAPTPGGAYAAPEQSAKQTHASPEKSNDPNGHVSAARGKKHFRITFITGDVVIARAIIKDEYFLTIYRVEGGEFREALTNIKSIVPFVHEE